jgi:hypothetical protein
MDYSCCASVQNTNGSVVSKAALNMGIGAPYCTARICALCFLLLMRTGTVLRCRRSLERVPRAAKGANKSHEENAELCVF